MKNIIFLFLFIPIASYSQETKNIAGLRGGPTFSKMSDGTQPSGHVKFSLGAFYTHKFKHFHLTFEPSLTQTSNSNNRFGGTTYKYSAYQLPVSLGYYTDKKLIAGAYVGFLPGIGTIETKNDFRHKKETNITLSGMIGGSLGYNISDKIACYFSLRYTVGVGEYSYFAPLLFVGYKF